MDNIEMLQLVPAGQIVYLSLLNTTFNIYPTKKETHH